jgi:phosphatidylserine/phosphatidylglycerophosphate/cardiolipin synthase-like enzyme
MRKHRVSNSEATPERLAYRRPMSHIQLVDHERPPKERVVHEGRGMIRRAAVIAMLLLSHPARAELQACFTPGEDCESLIAREIGTAKREILVQAYGFTSTQIARALADAVKRGVTVRAILDKTNEQKRYGIARYLELAGVPVLIDDKVAIQHNKLILIDQRTVLSGSFNFTKSAQQKNAENVLIARDEPGLAKRYVENWHRREALSRGYAGS